MTDTPTSNTSTLGPGRDIQDRMVIAQAENDFDRLQRSLSSQKVDNKVTSRESTSVDLEKGHDEDRHGTFDLREYLTSSNDANSAAGIRHKHVGVTWEDLEVSGIGGEDNKVCRYIDTPYNHHLTDRVRQIYVSTYAGRYSDSVYSFIPEPLRRRNHRTGHLPFRRSPQRAPTGSPKEVDAYTTSSENHP